MQIRRVREAYDVAIILGNTFSTPQTVESMRLRTERAVQLWKEGRCKKILFSGGYATNKLISEARYMSDIALEKGVPPTDIILEEKSRTTFENATRSREIIEKLSFNNAIIVTSHYHRTRAHYIFSNVFGREFELDYSVCGSNLSAFQSSMVYLREACSFILAVIRIWRFRLSSER